MSQRRATAGGNITVLPIEELKKRADGVSRPGEYRDAYAPASTGSTS